MKPPVLRVKKGTEKYDDNARKAEAPIRREEPQAAPRRPWIFRMRRVSLFPVLILVIVVLLLFRMVPRSPAQTDINGWHAVLEARVRAGGLDVGVAFSRRLLAGRAEKTDVSVVFFLPDNNQHAEVTGTLSGGRTALISRMPHTGAEKTVRAIVKIGGESRILSLGLDSGSPGP
ncbi:MAG TPA: hypothetical protein VMM82_02710 [Spirochaetia bacterium]|nr:hypothetical protein [Spirochaetia bacterium]